MQAIDSRIAILLGVTLVSLAGLLLLPTIPQDQAYHQFADRRMFFGIPNFWNVLSNLPFLLVGAAGLRLGGSLSTRTIFLGISLVAFGSAYYHWSPGDGTLLWDRLPMTIGFMGILANQIEQRVSAKSGAFLLWPLLVLGLLSLLVWRWTGDLRLYGWVVLFPIVLLPLIFWLFPRQDGSTGYWLAAAGLYVIAKLFEHFDAAVFSAGQIVSGHTLKHLFAAAACFMILRNFQRSNS